MRIMAQPESQEPEGDETRQRSLSGASLAVGLWIAGSAVLMIWVGITVWSL
jgi:hypothetical protein